MHPICKATISYFNLLLFKQYVISIVRISQNRALCITALNSRIEEERVDFAEISTNRSAYNYCVCSSDQIKKHQWASYLVFGIAVAAETN